MVHDGIASSVGRFFVELDANRMVVFETTNLSAGADPVLHLFDPHRVEVAVDDNGAGGTGARLTYSPADAGWYMLIVRSRQTGAEGTANLMKDGLLWHVGVRFGGWQIHLETLRAQEEIRTIRLPGGSNSPDLYFLKADGLGIEALSPSGTAGARLAFSTALGSRFIIVGTDQTHLPGPTRVVRNDAALNGHDSDKDGLGVELEEALETCPSLSGYAGSLDCEVATDPRDTDGDGISDGWEVLGRSYSWEIEPGVRRHATLPLPLWGADPRHKDLFIEVDFQKRTEEQNRDHRDSAELKMPPDVARYMAAVYGDAYTQDDDLRADHAEMLVNPDGETGISVHLDTGVPPEHPDDATIYGDWGGYTATDAVETSDGFRGEDFRSAWRQYMGPERLGVFRYALAYQSGGGQSPEGFATGYNFTSGPNSAHETGHSMGLGHSGPSRLHLFPDVNCKPNYPSIMNYAFYGQPDIGFSDGLRDLSAPALNNTALRERNAVDPRATSLLDTLERVFGYVVDRQNGHVDWNRDGVFESGTVRAYANYRPGGSCEFTRYNETFVYPAWSDHPPSLARLGDHLYLFYVTLAGEIAYTHSTSSWECPIIEATRCVDGYWDDSVRLILDTRKRVLSVDATRFALADGSEELLVVWMDSEGRLWQQRLRLDDDGEKWSDTEPVPGDAMGEVSLATANDGRTVYLAFKSRADLVHFNHFRPEEGWSFDQRAIGPQGQIIKTARFASPAIVEAFLPWKPGEAGIYGAFPDVKGYLGMWWLNPETNLWEKTDSMESPRYPEEGRAALAWVPYNDEAPQRGRLYLAYVAHDADPRTLYPERVVSMMMSYVRASDRAQMVGLEADMDNSWYFAFGIDLFYEPGVDSNLRAVESRQRPPSGDRPSMDFQVWFRPKADGILDFTYKNYNDWETLAVGVCQYVVNPGGLVDDPIRCPEWPSQE